MSDINPQLDKDQASALNARILALTSHEDLLNSALEHDAREGVLAKVLRLSDPASNALLDDALSADSEAPKGMNERILMAIDREIESSTKTVAGSIRSWGWVQRAVVAASLVLSTGLLWYGWQHPEGISGVLNNLPNLAVAQPVTLDWALLSDETYQAVYAETDFLTPAAEIWDETELGEFPLY